MSPKSGSWCLHYFAQRAWEHVIFPGLNMATVEPAVWDGIWLIYKNVRGFLLALGGQDLFLLPVPTCCVIPVSCVGNARVKSS